LLGYLGGGARLSLESLAFFVHSEKFTIHGYLDFRLKKSNDRKAPVLLSEPSCDLWSDAFAGLNVRARISKGAGGNWKRGG
jgi:hypothetical protein